MGDLGLRQGRLDEAQRWTCEGIELAERLGEVGLVAEGYQQLGELWGALGEYERLDASFARALETLDRAELPRAQALDRYRRARGGQAEPLRGS